jgi:hypothetical protein
MIISSISSLLHSRFFASIRGSKSLNESAPHRPTGERDKISRMQRELQRPEIEAKPDWHGRNEVEAIKNPERMGCFDPQSMIYDPSSLRFFATLAPWR